MNWGGLEKFEVGRAARTRSQPFKRFFLALFVVAYLIKGLIIFILMKLLSRKAKDYKFLRVLLTWPRAYLEMFANLHKIK